MKMLMGFLFGCIVVWVAWMGVEVIEKWLIEEVNAPELPSSRPLPTPIPLPVVASQATECGAAGDPCVINGRHYNVLLPEGEGPFPVLLFFHESLSSGNDIVENGIIVDSALARGYAIIAPTASGIDDSGPYQGTRWVGYEVNDKRDDYRFARRVVSDAEKRFPIDTSRILAAGHASGAEFIWHMSCTATDYRLSALATIEDTYNLRGIPHCKDMRPRFSLMHTYGLFDSIRADVSRQNGVRRYEEIRATQFIKKIVDAANCREKTTTTIGIFVTTKWSRCMTGDQFGLAQHTGNRAVPIGWTDFILDWFEGL